MSAVTPKKSFTRPVRSSAGAVSDVTRPGRTSAGAVNNFISERLGEVDTKSKASVKDSPVILRDRNKRKLTPNERRLVCKSLNDMCNSDVRGPDDVAKKEDLTKVGTSNLFSLFTKRFSASDNAINVQCDRLNKKPSTEILDKEKDKPTSDQRKKLLVAALLLEPEKDPKSKPIVQKSNMKTITSPKLQKKAVKKSTKGLKVKKKSSFKGNRKVTPAHSDDALIAENQVKITESLKKIPGRTSLAKKKGVVTPAPPNCSKIVSFVHNEEPEVLGVEEEEEDEETSGEEEERNGTISFRTISHTVKTLVNVRSKRGSGET